MFAQGLVDELLEELKSIVDVFQGRQALFGAGQILDWNDRPHQRSTKPARKENCLLFVTAYRPCRMVQAIKRRYGNATALSIGPCAGVV